MKNNFTWLFVIAVGLSLFWYGWRGILLKSPKKGKWGSFKEAIIDIFISAMIWYLLLGVLLFVLGIFGVFRGWWPVE